ncbi:MAG: 23S rRNA (pseudouridine(1915)-N(3))-methyltransferase RlmH [Bacteroidota bacterium]
MKIKLLVVGKTDAPYLREGIAHYEQRLRHYIPLEMTVIPDLRQRGKYSPEQQKVEEGHALLKHIAPTDQVWLLDERGKSFTSKGLSGFMQTSMNAGHKWLVFVVGGPYGFSEAVYARAQGRISLSDMTFSHQMVRLFFMEQLYRAFTILRGEPYQHD